ncbi:TPA: nucleotide-binding protein [Klebsiella pneumoniae]|nr:nucleotide-binding protein [Klebsiella pneumoniae]
MSDKPTVFIASSSEAIRVAEAVHIKLEQEMSVKNWENAFDLSSVTISRLIEKTKSVDYAIFVFHPDDKIFIRNEEYSSTRDNVVLELGMFIGALGLEKCFILVPKTAISNFRLPSDLAGVTTSTYNDQEVKLTDAVTGSCAKIKESIRGLEASKAKTENTDEIHTLREELNDAQSKIWHMTHDLQRANTEVKFSQGAIRDFFFSIAKPATPAEIKDWEEGAKISQLKDIKIELGAVYFVNKDVIIPQLYGTHSISIIIDNNAKVYGVDKFSHNRIYYMDGFRTDRTW